MFIVRLLTIFSLATAAALVRAQVAVQNGMGFDSHCGSDYCVSGIYTPSNKMINYTLVVAKGGAGQDVGWWAIGQGTQMSGANMAINWVNPDKTSLTTSHRSAQGNQMPQAQLASALSFQSNADVGKTRDGTTYWSWSMALPASSQMNAVQHIFSTNAVGPTSNDPNTVLYKHDRHEQGIVFDLTKKYNGNLPAGLVSMNGQLQADLTATMGGSVSSATSSGSGENEKSHRLFIVHMSFMLLTWLILVPAGILVARFGRTYFPIYKPHSTIQYVSLFTLFVGFFFAVGGCVVGNIPHFDETHTKLGLTIFCLVIFQVILGAVTHALNHSKGIRAVAFLHMPLGLITFGLAIWNIHLGFNVYEPRAPNYASYIVYAWAAVLAAVYVVGFYKIKRELEHRQNEIREREDAKPLHTSNTPPSSD